MDAQCSRFSSPTGIVSTFVLNSWLKNALSLDSTKVYAIIVRLDALSKPVGCNPNDPLDSGRHYRLRVEGSNALALDTPTRSTLEHADRVNWAVHHDGGPKLELGFTTDPALSGFANGPFGTQQIEFVDPSAVTTSTSTITIPGVATAVGAFGIWHAITQVNGHHNIQKLTGLDRHLYLDWASCPHGARTIGYWRNHESHVAAMLLQNGPIDLGGGTTVGTVSQAVSILSIASAQDARNSLRAQLLATILNLRNGANPSATGSDIRPTVNAAKGFLASHTTAVTGNHPDRAMGLALKDQLDAFNNSGE